MDKEDLIEEMIDEIDSVLFMAEWPTSKMIPEIVHLEWCIWKLKEVKEFLEDLTK